MPGPFSTGNNRAPLLSAYPTRFPGARALSAPGVLRFAEAVLGRAFNCSTAIR